jgi:phosphatidate cytidylyltransferase
MSWRVALADPVFRTYAIIIFSLLAFGGVVLATLTFALKKNVAKVWTIWKSWIIMAPAGLFVVALGREATIIGITFLALVAFREFARATGLNGDRGITAVVYVAIVVMGAAAWLPDPQTGWTRPGWLGLMQAMPIYAIAAIWCVPIVRNRVQGQVQLVSLAIVGFLCIGWMFAHLCFLANSAHAYGYIAFIVFAVEITDISAYTFGKLFGRRAFRSNISPNKTWGGAIGAVGVAMALPWVLGFSFPPAFGWREKIVIGLIVGFGAQLGDLAVSLIKRDLGIKDMGVAIPGHGGILDRIDSLIFVAPVFVRFVYFVEPIG